MAKLKEIIGEELFKQLSEDKQKEFKDKDFEDISGGAYIPKQRFDQVNEQAKEYKKQVGERDTQITKLKEEFKDTEGLKEKVEKLETDNKTQKETYEKQLADIAFNNALEKSLGSYKIRDSKLVMALIDKDKLKVDGDAVIGLKEQIEPLQKSHEYLFEKEVPGTGSFITGGGDPTPGKQMELGERLAKEKSEQMKASETLNNFFK